MASRTPIAFTVFSVVASLTATVTAAAQATEQESMFLERATVRLDLSGPERNVAAEAAPTVSLAVIGQDEAAAEQAGVPMPGPARRFGDAATWRFNVLAFYGDDFESGHFFGGAVSVTYFMIDNLSVDFELGMASFGQDGPDAWGGNFNILLRWHFLARDTWSLYLDGGVGFLKTNDDVPDNGSNYNFTPQAGVGASFDIGNDWRMMVGVRWHHISNADTADSNPGRDSLMGYAGISVPFMGEPERILRAWSSRLPLIRSMTLA